MNQHEVPPQERQSGIWFITITMPTHKPLKYMDFIMYVVLMTIECIMSKRQWYG